LALYPNLLASRFGKQLNRRNKMALPEIPNTALATKYRPKVYQAFSDLIANSDISGIGANVRDIEILRLSCLEKVRRDGANATSNSGFQLNFLANLSADWAEDRVQFWDEGLGRGWNLLVNDGCPTFLLSRVLFYGSFPHVFALFPIPIRLPHLDCEIYEDFTICHRNNQAPPLTLAEKAVWENFAKQRYGNNANLTSFDWSE
jgi:hypothetical protein